MDVGSGGNTSIAAVGDRLSPGYPLPYFHIQAGVMGIAGLNIVAVVNDDQNAVTAVPASESDPSVCSCFYLGASWHSNIQTIMHPAPARPKVEEILPLTGQSKAFLQLPVNQENITGSQLGSPGNNQFCVGLDAVGIRNGVCPGDFIQRHIVAL